jgi:RpiB/LacA/LacB family sugar-phosphate isomerase
VEVSQQVARRIVEDAGARGVLICGTGIGISIVANKYEGVYAARCVTVQDAVDSRTINNANVLCLSVGTPIEVNREIVRAFMGTAFPGDERRVRRLEKIVAMEGENFK